MIETVLYAGYLIWLLAGLADFVCHRRTDLPHTSGITESFLHWAQLALMGSCLIVGLVFELTPLSMMAIGLLVLAHAVVGYLDTRSAYGLREIGPFEQHVHSVLDMAPWTGLLLTSLTLASFESTGFNLRDPAVAPAWWAAILVPGVVLCGIPALLETRAALRAGTTNKRPQYKASDD